MESWRFDTSVMFCRSPCHHPCIIQFDGAAKPNPGKGGSGAVLYEDNQDAYWICKTREGLGHSTNNEAEYKGLLLGLRTALEKGYIDVTVLGDSMLVVNQVNGNWKIKNPRLQALYDEAADLINQFRSFQIIHISRESNTDADAEACLAVDLDEWEIECDDY